MPGPMLAYGLGMALPMLLMGGMQSMGGGMNSCCNGVFGGPQQQGGDNGALFGGVAGGVLGGLSGGLGGALLGGFGGAALGSLLGRLFDRHQHNHGQNGQHGNCGCPQNYGPPQGAPWGGQSNGCYGGGQQNWGGQQQWGGGNQYQQGYQDGYNQGQQYQQGYNNGYDQAMGNQCGQQWPPRNCWQPQNDGCRPNDGCGRPQQPQGQLTQEGEGKPINYTTSGGWKVVVNGDKLVATDPSGQHKIEWSGDPHEYVDGKHVKDWDGKVRSLILPDGTKFTGNADSPTGVMKHLSIYDGNRNIQIENAGNKITHSSNNPWDTRSREAWQPDGETAMVSLDRCGMNYTNIYNQDNNLGFKPLHKDLAFSPNKTRIPVDQYPPYYRERVMYA